MKKVRLEEIITKRIKNIKSATELLFIKYINDYLKDYGEELQLSFVVDDVNLRKTYYYRYIGKTLGLFSINLKPYIPGYEIDRRDILNEEVSDYLTYGITDKEIIFDVEKNRFNQESLMGRQASTTYISLIAKLLVESYKRGIDLKPIKIKAYNGTERIEDITDLQMLITTGNRLLENLVTIEKEDTIVDSEWLAFVRYGQQNGMFLDEPDAKARKSLLDKKFKKNQIVLFYCLETKYKNKEVRNITQCFPAKILDWNKRTITLEYYPLVKTTQTQVEHLDNIKSKTKVTYFTEGDYYRFPRRKETYSLITIGIEGETNTRKDNFMILKPFDGTDKTKQLVKQRNGKYKEKELTTTQTIKEIMKDRKLEGIFETTVY